MDPQGGQMTALDLIAGLIIGGYLIGAVSRGKTGDLIALAKRDADFLKWAIALAALFYVRTLPDIGGIATALTGAAILGFLLYNIGPIQSNATALWAKI